MAKRKESEHVETLLTEAQDPELAQFPSALGEPGVEVAKRGPDNHESSSNTHRKVFTLQAEAYNEDEPGTLHEDNARALRQEMLELGLRPTGDVSFEGSHPAESDPKHSVHLVYTVGAEPAASATTYTVEHAFPDEDEQHLLEEGSPSPRDES